MGGPGATIPADITLPGASGSGSQYGAGVNGSYPVPLALLGSLGPILHLTADTTVDDVVKAFEQADPTVRAQIQGLMFQAGYYPSGALPLPGGVLKPADQTAFAQAVTMAAHTQTPLDQYLQSAAQANASVGGSATKRVEPPAVIEPGVVSSGGHTTIHLNNPDTLNAAFDVAFQKALGRNATDAEKSAMVPDFQAQEQAQGLADFAGTEAARKASFDATVQNRNDKFAADVANRNSQYGMPVGSSAQTLLGQAQSMVGGKYVWGGKDPATGVDCSGFTQWLFQQQGITIGGDTSAQRQSSALSDVQGGLANAQPGDLLFFGDKAGAHAHVGIYLGGGKMVSAENPQSGIQIADISSGSFGTEVLNQVRRAPQIAQDNAAAAKLTAAGGGATAGGTGAPVPDAILAATSDPHVQLAMLVGSHLEGGWGPTYGVGDGGNSHGPFQINAPYHKDISVADAQDPTKATAYMLGAYQAAVAQIPAAVWASDPKGAAEEAAHIAERPQQPYHVAQGQAAVDRAFADAQAVLSGQPTGPGTVAGDAIRSGYAGGNTGTPANQTGMGGPDTGPGSAAGDAIRSGFAGGGQDLAARPIGTSPIQRPTVPDKALPDIFVPGSTTTTTSPASPDAYALAQAKKAHPAEYQANALVNAYDVFQQLMQGRATDTGASRPVNKA